MSNPSMPDRFPVDPCAPASPLAPALTERERECLHGVLAAVSSLDRAGIQRVFAFAHNLASEARA